MTVIEQRFMESAIAFFNRTKQSEFIEVTPTDNPSIKLSVRKDAIKMLAKNNETTVLYLDVVAPITITVTETYDQIKAMLNA